MGNMLGFFQNDDWLIPTARRRFVRLSVGYGQTTVFRYELVQGKKRKIRVMFHDNIAEHLTSADIQQAAKVADQRGWKKAVILSDYGMADTLEIFNMHGFHHAYKNRDQGVFLKALPASF